MKKTINVNLYNATAQKKGVNTVFLKKNSKWIVGYSDVTVLHSHLNNLGIASLHATMPINVKSNTKESLSSLKNSLFGNLNSIECKAHPLNKFGKIEGDQVWLAMDGRGIDRFNLKTNKNH